MRIIIFLAFLLALYSPGWCDDEPLPWREMVMTEPDQDDRLFDLAAGEDPEFERDPNYTRVESWVNIPGFGLQKKISYIQKEIQVMPVSAAPPGWLRLQKENPALYGFIRFFNPHPLQNPPAFLATLLVAMGSVFALRKLKRTGRIFLLCLWVYSWGRIISFLAIFVLASSGVLPGDAKSVCFGFGEF